MEDWVPSPDDIAALIRARTRNTAGVEVGRWTSDTRPRYDQVEELIDTVVVRIRAKAGRIPDHLQSFARRVAAVGVAYYIEGSFFPEQKNEGQYETLKQEFDETFPELVSAAQNDDGDDTTGDEFLNMPLNTFDTDRVLLGPNVLW